MSAIVDFLKTIVDFFKTLIDIVIKLCEDLVEFIKNIMRMPEFMSSTFSGNILPPVVISTIGVLVVTVILLRVLGRD
jgi:phage-related minor tail protein